MPRAMAALWKMSTSPFTVTGKERNKKRRQNIVILCLCWSLLAGALSNPLPGRRYRSNSLSGQSKIYINKQQHFQHIAMLYCYVLCMLKYRWSSLVGQLITTLLSVVCDKIHETTSSFVLWAWGWRRWWPRKPNLQTRANGKKIKLGWGPGRQRYTHRKCKSKV